MGDSPMSGVEESAVSDMPNVWTPNGLATRRRVAALREPGRSPLQGRYSLTHSELDKPGDVVDVEFVHDLTATCVYCLRADVDLSGDFFRRHAV